MFSHITVGTNNLENAIIFYDAILKPLGFVRRIVEPDGGPEAACWCVIGQNIPRFYVYKPFNREPATHGNGSMVSFIAPSISVVNMVYMIGINLGAIDEGKPGFRPHYGKGYYGAYMRDLDGNKIHFVYYDDNGDM